LTDVLKVQRFKFAGKVAAAGGELQVVQDLLASAPFASHTLGLMGALGPEQCSALEVSPLPATVTHMGFFDPLEKEELLAPNGYLRKCLNDRVAGVEVDTLVTDMLLNEDSEHAHVFGAAARSEFLFQLFQAFFIGGAMHQRDEDALEYLEQTKVRRFAIGASRLPLILYLWEGGGGRRKRGTNSQRHFSCAASCGYHLRRTRVQNTSSANSASFTRKRFHRPRTRNC
jgi:hypothetical protein